MIETVSIDRNNFTSMVRNVNDNNNTCFSSQAAEYGDGTPATASQMAKDVATFLRWCSEPELDDRRLMTIKAIGIFSLLAVVGAYFKRHKWSTMKSRKIAYKPISKK